MGGKKSPVVLWSSASDKLIRSVLIEECNRLSIPYYVSPFKGSFVKRPKSSNTIIAFGNKCVDSLRDLSLVPKNRTIENLRGFPYHSEGVSYFVSFDPFTTEVTADSKSKISIDLMTAYRFSHTGSITPKIGTYRRVKDFSDTLALIKKKYDKTGSKVPVSIDLETVGFDYMSPNGWIVCMSVTVEKGYSDVLFFRSAAGANDHAKKQLTPKIKKQIDILMKSDRIKRVGANFKFDMLWMAKKWGVFCKDLAFDIVIAGSLLDENRSNSLNTLSKIHSSMGGYDDEFNKKYDKSKMHEVPRKELTDYAGGDTDACLRVYSNLRSELVSIKPLANFYKQVLSPAIMTFTKMEYRGCLIDVGYYQKLAKEVEADKKKVEDKIFDLFPSKMKKKWRDSFSLNKAEMKIELLFSKNGFGLEPVMFTEKTKQPSTSMEHIEMFADDENAKQFVEYMSEYASAEKTLTSFIGDLDKKKGFLQHLRSDGRYHPNYFLFHGDDYDNDVSGGTDTGRTSAKNPAIQTLPKHTKWAKKLRKGFIAPPGYVILSADYSQAELRIIAVLSKCLRMLNAYKKGIDIHKVTAAEMMGITVKQFEQLPQEEQELKRFYAKSINFGIIYGISPESIVEDVRKTYKVIMPLEMAYEAHHKFLNVSYPEIKDYQKVQETKARNLGFVRSPLGRIHHLPLANSPDAKVRSKQGRKAVNSPVQSTASDLTIMAMNEIDRQYAMHLFVMIHDNAAAYVKEDNLERDAKRMTEVMESLPLKEKFGWDVPITFKAEVDWGYNLGDMTELKV